MHFQPWAGLQMSDLTEELSDDTVEIGNRVLAREKRAPNVSVEMKDGQANLFIGENSEPAEFLKLMEAMGTCDRLFISPLLSQIANAVSSKGELKEEAMQFAVSFIKSIEPENEVEALLAAQMAAVHVCAMDTSRRYMWAETLQGRDSAERALTKLTRTFTTQMETLKKYRSNAQQVVRVERVNVESGGQAIVGDVSTGGKGRHEK
jgi:hypothetical protein